MVVVAGASVLSVRHYQKYQNKQVQAAAVVEKKRADEVAEQTAQYDHLAGEYRELLAECQKGMVAYGQLTATLKSRTPQPLCAAADSKKL